MHPKYIEFLNWEHLDIFDQVSIRVVKTEKEYRLYGRQAIRFLKHYTPYVLG